MISLAERIVAYLVGTEPLMEDRIDDFIKRYGARVPGHDEDAKRRKVQYWITKDPTFRPVQGEAGQPGYRRLMPGRYVPWMLREFAAGRTEWNELDLDRVHDALAEFERLLAIPAFQGDRDILKYDLDKLCQVTDENRELQSNAAIQRKEHERKRRLWQPEEGNQAGRRGMTVAKTASTDSGDYQVLKITESETLSYWAWQAYSANNPNWEYPPLVPGMTPEQIKSQKPWSGGHHQPWCVRGTSFGDNYMGREPGHAFYVVLKNGGPYVGLAFVSGQAKDLINRDISIGVAEEIWPVVDDIIREFKAGGNSFGHGAQVFDQLRIVRGELTAGEKIQSADLSGSSIAVLPDNLTVEGDLNLSNTRITRLPVDLKVHGSLMLSGTKIAELSPGLEVRGSLNLSGTNITSLPQGMKITTLDLSGSRITQLPPGMVVDTLKMNNTAIVQLPGDLKAKKVLYSPETLPDRAIRQYFLEQRREHLKAHFWKESKFAGFTEEQKEAAWVEFQDQMTDYFMKSPTIAKAISAKFEPVRAAS